MKNHAPCLIRCCGLLLTTTYWPMPVSAQASPVQQSEPQPADSAADIASRTDPPYTLRADTELHLRMLDTVASNTHKRLDRFKLELVEPIVFEGREIVPVGTLAEGEVVHSAKADMAGRAGELILATRLLRFGDQQIKLRSFNAGTGQNRYNLATGLGVTLDLPALFVVGKNISVPSGTDVYAKVASDYALPLSPPSASMSHSTSTENQPTETTNQQ